MQVLYLRWLKAPVDVAIVCKRNHGNARQPEMFFLIPIAWPPNNLAKEVNSKTSTFTTVDVTMPAGHGPNVKLEIQR